MKVCWISWELARARTAAQAHIPLARQPLAHRRLNTEHKAEERAYFSSRYLHLAHRGRDIEGIGGFRYYFSCAKKAVSRWDAAYPVVNWLTQLFRHASICSSKSLRKSGRELQRVFVHRVRF